MMEGFKVGPIVVYTVVFFAPQFQCWYFRESRCLFYLSFKFDFYISKLMLL